MENRKEQEECSEDQALYRLIFHNSNHAIGLSKNGLHYKVNKAHLELLGVEDESRILGRPTTDFIAPEELDHVRGIVAARSRGEEVPSTYITKGIRADGSRFIMEVYANSYFIGKDAFTVVVLRDATDRFVSDQIVGLLRTIDEFLGTSSDIDEAFKFILERCVELEHIDCGGIYMVDGERERVFLQSHIGLSEDFIKQVMEYKKNSINYQMVINGEFIYGQFGEIRSLEDSHILKKEGIRAIAILPIKHKNRVIAAVNLASRKYNEIPQSLRNGLESVTWHICRAMTRMRTEQELTESEHKYRTLVESSPDAICIIQDEKIRFCNETMCQKSGYSREELLNMHFTGLIAPSERTMAEERATRRFRGEDIGDQVYGIIRKDGSELTVQIIGRPMVLWKGRPALLIQARDVSRERELERQLQHSQRMESLGTLASGIAHDFNNVLMALQGNVSLMLLNHEKAHPDYCRLLAMQESISDATGMTRQLLGFARGSKLEKTPSDLSLIVEKAIKMFAPARKDVTFEFSPMGPAPVEVDVNQIEQVLANLIINAFQAMPTGGVIRAALDFIVMEPDQSETTKIKPGKYVRLSISDTGSGIGPDILKRIFDPFFSTKEKSQGSGLGLTSAYWIIKNHGGMIRIESALGRGSTFTVYLPFSEKAVYQEHESEAEILPGKGVILVVDDEARVLDALSDMCEKLGYEVIKVSSSREAMSVYWENRASIDLVLLDFLMPEMNGKQLFGIIRDINPKAKIILCTGYSMDDQIKDILPKVDGVINKPVNIVQLSRKIKSALEPSVKAAPGPTEQAKGTGQE